MILTEFQFRIEAHLSSSKSPDSLWHQLVQSARRMHGEGCNGILLEQAVKCGMEILTNASNDEIMEMWKETENGVMATEEGDTDPDREEMLKHIEMELHESLCNRVCQEVIGEKKA